MTRNDEALPAPRGKTRNDILNALKRADGLTVDQLSRGIGITPMAVRKHLAALEREELVAAELVRRPVGRPARAYRLTSQSESLFPRGYDSIAVEFLSDLVMMDGPEKVDLLFNRRADRAYAFLEARVSRARSFDEQVAALASGMDELGYLTQWEKTGPGAYAVRQYNCAIQKIAMTFPQACYYELETYRRLLNAEVERVCHLMAGDHMCSYVIRQRAPAPTAPQ
ncbi:MAG TPA: ArsR family transcriptional regulator [Thermomicrobiales bacterium]|nr:ArsR family transcriptional regulator [Thermomicrobiales bacterium]